MYVQLPKRPGKRGRSAKSIPGTEETNVWQRFFYTHYGSCTWPPSVARAGGVMTVRGAVDGAAGSEPRHVLRGCGERARCLVWSVSDPESAEVRHGPFPFRPPNESQPEGPRSTIPSREPFPKPIYQLYFERIDFFYLDSSLKGLQFCVYKSDFTKLMFMPPPI